MEFAGTKVLIGPSSFGAVDDSPFRLLVESGCTVIGNPYARKLTEDELIALLADGVSGLIAGVESLDRTVLEQSDLRVISRCGAGLSNVDLEATEEFGIQVFTTPDAPTTAVAELTLGALLSLLRSLPAMDRRVRRREWKKTVGRQLNGQAVAVIGYGRIGRNVGRLLTAFGARVMAVDPAYGGEVDGVPMVSLDEAISSADIITLHCSGEEEILGEQEFSSMKDGVYVLNAARGSLIDEDALNQALESEKVRGAWMDAFLIEPYEGPLLNQKRVLLTPHAGSYTRECRLSMESEAVENLFMGLRRLEEGVT